MRVTSALSPRTRAVTALYELAAWAGAHDLDNATEIAGWLRALTRGTCPPAALAADIQRAARSWEPLHLGMADRLADAALLVAAIPSEPAQRQSA
jgi:hypothetical protein